MTSINILESSACCDGSLVMGTQWWAIYLVTPLQRTPAICLQAKILTNTVEVSRVLSVWMCVRHSGCLRNLYFTSLPPYDVRHSWSAIPWCADYLPTQKYWWIIPNTCLNILGNNKCWDLKFYLKCEIDESLRIEQSTLPRHRESWDGKKRLIRSFIRKMSYNSRTFQSSINIVHSVYLTSGFFYLRCLF